jgi:uncharacterized protein (TIGR04255 family)
MEKPRPSHLPDFKNPPLNEMIVGVQFSQPTLYSSIYTGEIWDLFKGNYPNVQEQPPLAPSFETFGTPFGAQISFNLGGFPVHPRYWFISQDESELLQFQPDRLLHNWRRLAGKKNQYPRFEKIIEKFENELKMLESYFNRFGQTQLGINQCEITYVNHIYSEGATATEPNPSEWLRFLAFAETPSDFSTTYRKVLFGGTRKPYGRLIIEVSSAIDANQRNLINFTLAVRGTADGPCIEDALKFLHVGRETIVNNFEKLTTARAHSEWGLK